jgi:hypothetical protein
VAGQAGGQFQHPPLPARARQSAFVQRGHHGCPVDGGRAGSVVDEAGEIVADEPRPMGNDQPGCRLEGVEAVCAGAECR